MKLRGKGINLQALVESGSYLIFSLLLYRLTASGRYLNYVTPRMKPYLYGLSLLMLVWTVVEARHIFTPRYKARLTRTFVLVLPILLLLSPPPLPEGSSMVRNFDSTGFTAAGASFAGRNGGSQDSSGGNGGSPDSYDQYSGSQYSGSQFPDSQYSDDPYSDSQSGRDTYDGAGSQDAGDDYSQYAGNEYEDSQDMEEDGGYSTDGSAQDSGAAPFNKIKIDLKGLDEKAKTITIADEDYYAWMVELGTNPDKYKDYTVSAKGFIYRDSEIEKRCNFALVRLSMWCCAADMSPMGFLVDYDGDMKFHKDEWVVVTGTFELNADGSLHLKARSIVAGKKPEEEYLYPF